MSNIVIIGAGGFIGKNLLLKLGILNRSIVAIDKAFIDSENGSTIFIGGDGDNISIYNNLNLKNAIVVYLGGCSRPSTSLNLLSDEIDMEVKPFVQLCDFFTKSGVSKIIFSSSGGTVYGKSANEFNDEFDIERPQNFYGLTKLINEQALRVLSGLSGLQSIILRISNPYGPHQFSRRGQGFIAAAMETLFNKNELVIWGNGSIIRDFIYIDDVVDAFIACISSATNSQILNISSGVGSSLSKICSIIENVSQRKLNIVYRDTRQCDLDKNVLSNSLAFRNIGWHPRFSIEDGIANTYNWWLKNSTN